MWLLYCWSLVMPKGSSNHFQANVYKIWIHWDIVSLLWKHCQQQQTQANTRNRCDSCSEQSFLFPSAKLKWQDKVAAYTPVVTSVGYIYLITTGELGSLLRHRDEPKLTTAGKPALFQTCHVDVMPRSVDRDINERIGVSWWLQTQPPTNTTQPQPKVSLQQEATVHLVWGEAAGRERSRHLYTRVPINLLSPAG